MTIPIASRRVPFAITAAAAAAVLSIISPRNAAANITIVPTWDATINSDPNVATIKATIMSAINEYQGRFGDSATINIKFQEMGSGLGASNSWFYTVPWTTYRGAL